jgi:hypothetical protein
MFKTITKEQLKEIEEAYSFSKEDCFDLLEEYTGIVVKPYIAYLFYDEVGNCIGDSDNYDIQDLLDNAYIKAVE